MKPFAMRRMIAALLCLTLLTLLTVGLSGCGKKDKTLTVRYLNFKPEQSRQWTALADAYTRETGVPVTVVTAASGTYEDALRAEMEKNEPPTLFQVNGPAGLRTWGAYCLDLRDTALYQLLR